jgi:hypothetical protein
MIPIRYRINLSIKIIGNSTILLLRNDFNSYLQVSPKLALVMIAALPLFILGGMHAAKVNKVQGFWEKGSKDKQLAAAGQLVAEGNYDY